VVAIGIEFIKIWVVLSGMAVLKEGRVVLGTVKVDSSVDDSESVEIVLEESGGRSYGMHWSGLGNERSVVLVPSGVQSTTSILCDTFNC